VLWEIKQLTGNLDNQSGDWFTPQLDHPCENHSAVADNSLIKRQLLIHWPGKNVLKN
jgi:hypothetical protein